MNFPLEIYHAIVREATRVPEAFDTSVSVIREDREAVLQLIHQSMLTKTALSLVSKTFRDITEPYLYEIVIFFNFDHVPTLLKLFRSTPPGSHTPLGHRCRRLDFYLGLGGEPYPDYAWNEGAHTLWGLVPACPRLEILICRAVFVGARTFPEFPHITHKSLWKTIARCWAGTLRRFELYGFHIRMDFLELMLRYFSKLEVCHITHLVAFKEAAKDRESGEGEDVDVFDDEEPKATLSGFPRRIWGQDVAASYAADRADSEGPSGWFDTDTVAEFAEAKRSASWPPYNGTAPYRLPSLHTLSLNNFNERIAQFDLPSVRQLAAHFPSYVDNKQMLAKTYQYFPAITTFNHTGVETPLNDILTFFPLLTDLTLHIYRTKFYPSTPDKPHLNLAIVRLPLCTLRFDAAPYIDAILSYVQAGMLPALRTVEITRYGMYLPDEDLPFDESEALGVELRVRIVEPFRMNGAIERD
ncbi:hypothetical protein D9615_006772 [Tricholomella constricta]|uniref:Uncharacterized protein n=1 Tax=Tricholomella constricta TaxID=117010 RepID=A0A8H5H7R2_9AGAR|nr:hypothetical protein D9615_006772 [Tricholomella constricta]